MQQGLSKTIDDYVAAFIGRISGSLHIEVTEVSVVEDAEFPHWSAYGPWASLPGIYVFKNQSEILYVGRALRNTGVGNRIWSHCYLKHYPDSHGWGAVIRDPAVSVRIYSLDSDEANYWIAGLELYLIDRLQPTCNARTG
jgi:hypothetical protein